MPFEPSAPAAGPPRATSQASPESDPAKAEISPTLPLSEDAKPSERPPCEVYVKPSCPFSGGTVAFLCTYGMSFGVTNVEHHPEEKKRVADLLGAKKFETPTLFLDGKWLVAPTLSELKQHLGALGIAPQPQPAAP